MSNVEYRCPIEGCGNRLFAPAGGTSIKCHRHTDTVYEQVEEYHGPNFEYKPEGDTDPAKTGIATEGTRGIKSVNVQIDTSMSDNETRTFLREQYRRVSGGEKPDFRWGNSRLKEEIEAWEQYNAEQAKSQEEEGSDNGEAGSNDEDTGADETPEPVSDFAPDLEPSPEPTPADEELEDTHA